MSVPSDGRPGQSRHARVCAGVRGAAAARVSRGSSVHLIGVSVVYRYKPEVLEQLARHGVVPKATTPPTTARAVVNDIYRYELRLLAGSLPCGRVFEAGVLRQGGRGAKPLPGDGDADPALDRVASVCRAFGRRDVAAAASRFQSRLFEPHFQLMDLAVERGGAEADQILAA